MGALMVILANMIKKMSYGLYFMIKIYLNMS